MTPRAMRPPRATARSCAGRPRWLTETDRQPTTAAMTERPGITRSSSITVVDLRSRPARRSDSKELRQALYDEGDVVMADVLVNLHGDDHRARRRLENRLFRKDTHRRYEREFFPPVVAATLAPHVASGRAELVSAQPRDDDEPGGVHRRASTVRRATPRGDACTCTRT